MIGAVFCFALGAINIALIAHDPNAPWNWGAAVFCLGCAYLCARMGRR